MTDTEFHYAYLYIFTSLRDLHTNYEMPAPHGCFNFLQGLQVLPTKEGLAITSVTSIASFRDLMPGVLEKINAGDIIQFIDGMTWEQYQQTVKWESGGTNESGLARNALFYMTGRSGAYARPPRKDKVLFHSSHTQVVYTIKSAKNASIYTVTIPWVLVQKDDCLDKYNAWVEGGGLTTVATTKPSIQAFQAGRTTKKISHKVLTPAQRKAIKLADKTMKVRQYDLFKEELGEGEEDQIKVMAGLQLNPTDDPVLSWGIYTPRNLGVLSINAFTPIENEDNPILEKIRNLLINELKDTDALVIDMRDNGGGLISMADTLPQLFGGAKPVVPNAARAVVSPVNNNLFAAMDQADPWYNATQRAPVGSLYSPLIQFTTIEQANQVGAAYVKPVGVFNNGACYSACDLFAANVQDNDIAYIFGEDFHTGAGGANVVEYGNYLSVLNAGDFPILPFAETYPEKSAPYGFRVSFRQSVRVGPNTGKLIEDDGIAALVPNILPSYADLNSSSAINTQLETIANKLKEIGTFTGKSSLYFQLAQPLAFDVALGSEINLDFEIAGVSSIQIYSGDKKIGVPTAFTDLSKSKKQVSFDSGATATALQKYEVRALKADGSTWFSTYRNIRFLPVFASYINLEDNTTINIDLNKVSGMAQYDILATPGTGFRPETTGFTVGGTAGYAHDVDTQRSYFINSVKPFQVSIKGVYATEPDSGIYVGYKLNGSLVNALVSGDGTFDNTFTIPSSGPVELFFRFRSLFRSGNGKGFTISSVKISIGDETITDTL